MFDAAIRDVDEIHRLRIRGKRLRYTMEVTVGAFGKPLRELYTFVEESQRFLGIINDHAVAIDFYGAWETEDSPTRHALQTIIDIEQRGLQNELARFPEWWNPMYVGQFWCQWQDTVAPLPAPPPESHGADPPVDTHVKKKEPNNRRGVPTLLVLKRVVE